MRWSLARTVLPAVALALAAAGASGCAEEEAAAPDEVTWAGFVYAGEGTVEENRLGEGSVTVWPAPFDGEQLAMVQPYADYPGFWSVNLPPQTDVNIRIVGEGVRSTVWAGNSPRADGNWLGGALFAATDAWIEALFEAAGEDGDAYVTDPEGEWVRVIGAPYDLDWNCADIDVGGQTVGQGVQCWGDDGAGAWVPIESGQPVVFTATVPAGAFTVAHADAVESYVADAGDIVLALYFVGNG